MPIHVRWDDSGKSFIHMEIKGMWTLEEYLGASETVMQMVVSSPHDCYLAVDMTHSNSMPSNVMPHIRTAARKIPIKVLVLTGLPKLVIMLGGLIRTVRGSQSTTTTLWATNMDDARKQLVNHLAAKR
jgi:hypothetical protein